MHHTEVVILKLGSSLDWKTPNNRSFLTSLIANKKLKNINIKPTKKQSESTTLEK